MSAPSTPAPAIHRPAWKEALFNYGTLVLTAVGVLGWLFVQLASLREQGAVTNARLGAIEKRLDKSEARDEQILAAIAEVQVSIARLQAKP